VFNWDGAERLDITDFVALLQKLLSKADGKKNLSGFRPVRCYQYWDHLFLSSRMLYSR
jgi:hypothetical protein